MTSTKFSFFLFACLMLLLAVFDNAKYPLCASFEKCLPIAKAGNPSAKTTIGFFYDKGQGGVENNDEKALKWYLEAAETRSVAPKYT